MSNNKRQYDKRMNGINIGIAVLMSVLGVLTITACGNDNQNPNPIGTVISSESEIASKEETSTEDIPTDISSLTVPMSTENVDELKGYIANSTVDMKAYLDLLNMMSENGLGDEEGESSENAGTETCYSLIYLTDDDVPELVIYENECYSIYTISDNNVVECLVNGLYSVSPSYYERKGIIEKWSRWNGGGDEGSYAGEYYYISIENPYEEGRVADFGYEYNAVYNDDTWTGTGITDYYQEGETISEEAYQDIFIQNGISELYEDDTEKEAGRIGKSNL